MAQSLSDITDAELMEKLNHDDINAWSALVKKYNKLVYSIAYQILRNRHDAEDATQNAFVRLKIYAAKYDTTQALQPWLARIAGSEALRIYQKRKTKNNKESVRMDTQKVEIQSPITQSDEQVETAEINTLINAAIKQLPEPSRVALTLYYGSGFTQAEIAQQLGTSQVSISERIKAGVEKMKTTLKKSGIFTITPALFYEHALVIEPSPEFIQTLSKQIPTSFTTTSTATRKQAKTSKVNHKSSRFPAILKWALVLAITAIAYWTWQTPKITQTPRPISTPTATQTAESTPIKSSLQYIPFSKMEKITYKKGKMQQDLNKPKELLDGLILFQEDSHNWKAHTKNDTEVFIKTTKHNTIQDGMTTNTFTKPCLFEGTLECIEDATKLGFIISIELNDGKIVKLNTLMEKQGFVESNGRSAEIGTIGGNKGTAIDFKIFVWKPNQTWLTVLIMHPQKSNAYYFLGKSIPHLGTQYNIGFFAEKALEISKFGYQSLDTNWNPIKDDLLKNFRESIPNDDTQTPIVTEKKIDFQ